MKRRRAADYSTFAYMRRYLGRMVIVLTLVTPLLIVMTYQWAPRRAPDDLVAVALAAPQPRASTLQAHAQSPERSGRIEPLASQPGAASSVNGVSNRALTGGAEDAWRESARPTGWYRTAAAEHRVSPHLLEALHHVESSAATDGCLPNMHGSGAVGPLQFKPATFAEHGVDGNGDGVIDICGFVDSLVSAAAYLRALGADDDLESLTVRHALERYGTNVDRVLNLARYYRARDGSLTAGAPPQN